MLGVAGLRTSRPCLRLAPRSPDLRPTVGVLRSGSVNRRSAVGR
jgi:hypothetical protein